MAHSHFLNLPAQLAILNQWIWCRLSAQKLVVSRTKQILLTSYFEPCWAPKFDDWIAVLFDKFPRNVIWIMKPCETTNQLSTPAKMQPLQSVFSNLQTKFRISQVLFLCLRTSLSFQKMGEQDGFEPGLLRGIFPLTALEFGRLNWGWWLWSETRATVCWSG